MAHQYKSTCLSCGKEWNYTKKDLSLSTQNHRTNEMRKNLSNGISLLGKNKISSAIDTIDELPEVAHKCPSCGSENVSLAVVKDPTTANSNFNLIKFIIICAVVLVSIIVISICTTVLIINLSNDEPPTSKLATETTTENVIVPSATPEPTPTPASTPTSTSETTQDIIASTENECIIGSDKENVRKLLSKYKETPSIMGENALDFENDDLLITVYFDKNGKADGVFFMQNSFDGVDSLTGVGSYVSKHYDELVKLSTKDPNVKIESDYTKFNSQGVKKAPMELYIGNIPF